MKRMIFAIIILFIIFISMVISKFNAKEAEVNVDEVNSIESYIEKIYGWKEVTDEALPLFSNINDANEKWIWGTLRENIDDYEIDYEEIGNVAKQLFGENFNKQYPKEGTEFITYDEETQKYNVNEITLDAIKDTFLLNKIEKDKSSYIVEIVEYLVDYTDVDNDKVIVKNLNGEKIYELTEQEATEGNIKKIVKESIDKFSQKQVKLENENGNIVVISVST